MKIDIYMQMQNDQTHLSMFGQLAQAESTSQTANSEITLSLTTTELQIRFLFNVSTLISRYLCKEISRNVSHPVSGLKFLIRP